MNKEIEDRRGSIWPSHSQRLVSVRARKSSVSFSWAFRLSRICRLWPFTQFYKLTPIYSCLDWGLRPSSICFCLTSPFWRKLLLLMVEMVILVRMSIDRIYKCAVPFSAVPDHYLLLLMSQALPACPAPPPQWRCHVPSLPFFSHLPRRQKLLAW